MIIIKSILIFILAGLCEIGGGYLVWQWMKEGKPVWYGILGGIILAGYGIVAGNFSEIDHPISELADHPFHAKLSTLIPFPTRD